jgi:hypothetical protein
MRMQLWTSVRRMSTGQKPGRIKCEIIAGRFEWFANHSLFASISPGRTIGAIVKLRLIVLYGSLVLLVPARGER